MTKKIFFVSPIGSEGSAERRTSDFVLKSIIKPVSERLDYETLRSDLINSTNTIDQDIINQLNSADLVIADVTGTNANVMFELGYRFSLKSPLIVIAQSVAELPFDIHNLRVMIYEKELPDLEKMQSQLEQMIKVFENFKPESESKNLGEEMGEKMALDAISSGDFSKIKEFAELAKTFGLDK
ncbi:hypothetical protein LKI_01950 [Leuconostoc kimchii IMSNU 11154]|uniref:Nucleoside 2-deoxyribosyltransferase n=1 Tax=Leuconostoc kimchii (strain IMSNU 11154 / KCTC 2386 / IH25) TaxID=762051 RepID=D5T0Y4_LEUKI|nr:hypothetical protein [Leuconostoc kimchii]ADG39933.1 hypothetical protein LKI_01950 [Leuconostoc kimchii IMSNU 11154]